MWLHDTYMEMAMNKDQIKGRVKKAKGRLKEIVGKAIGNKSLEARGKRETAAGHIQTGYGDVGEELSDMKDDVKEGPGS